jgi:ADP-heptose:LPS heptosyltransferase
VDLALSISPPKRNAAVTLTSGAPRKVGYLTFAHSLTPYLQTTPVEAFGCTLAQHVSYGRENIEERSLKLCDALGIRREGAGPVVHLTEEIVETRRNALSARGEMPAREFIVIHPFSGWEYRSWSIDRYNRLAEMLLERTNHAIVFMCEKSEEKMMETSRRRFSNRDDVSFFVSDDLVATAVLLKDAAMVVCNDSGPLHLASALGTRCVALFGPAPASLTAPRHAVGTSLYKKTECSPCDQCACIRPENSCMSLISPEEVLDATLKELSLVPAVTAVANA